MTELQEFVSQFGTAIGPKKLCEKVYDAMRLKGHDVCLLNDRYIIVDGVRYCFRRRNGSWIVKEF